MGYVVALTSVAAILLVAGVGPGPALGVGAFVAVWGGARGGMVAAQRDADRSAAEERIARHGERREGEVAGLTTDSGRTCPVRAGSPGPYLIGGSI